MRPRSLYLKIFLVLVICLVASASFYFGRSLLVRAGKKLIAILPYEGNTSNYGSGFVDMFQASKNGNTIFYVVVDPSKRLSYAVVNGKKQKEFVGDYDYPTIGQVQISDDGKNVAYQVDITTKDPSTGPKRSFLYYLNGNEVKDAYGIKISAVGNRVAVIYHDKKDDNLRYVSVDGKANNEYFNVGLPEFSKDGKHYIYSAWVEPKDKDGKNNDRFVVVRDGRELASPILFNSSPTLSPDGMHYAFVGVKDDKDQKSDFVLTVNNKTYDIPRASGGDTFLGVSAVSNSGGYVYVLSSEKQVVGGISSEFKIVLNGQEINKFPNKFYLNDLQISDKNKIAYTILDETKNKKALFLNEKNISGWVNNINGIAFSPNGESVAYYAVDSENTYWVMLDDMLLIKVADKYNGYSAMPYLSGGLRFSPDGKTLFYFDNEIVSKISLVDKENNERLIAGSLEQTVFSPNGNSFVLSNNGSLFLNGKVEIGTGIVSAPFYINNDLVGFYSVDKQNLYRTNYKINTH